ncbi:MAG: alpha-1,2-fucosyltransferase, partial [Xanthomonadales bacterium]|nr:alpha-1,2-fucosyltransferase [Xanthomonadales bacterium]
YYHSAVETLAKLAEIDEIFVFSDDEHWARQHLQFQYPTRFMVGNKDHEDLWLMSQCRHHIIANSTFSWWGAWLAFDAQQTVIAPRQWFKTRKVTGLIPERWHQL